MNSNTSFGASIVGIEYALPAQIVTNETLAIAHPDWRMSQIFERTGVASRHICKTSETALDLGEAACRKLIDSLKLDTLTIDALIFCTQTPDFIMPGNSFLLQQRLGLTSMTAVFDLPLACSGFIYGLYLSRALIHSQQATNILLVTSETYSKLSHPNDRAVQTLFGDGAAAAVISRGARCIGQFVTGSDGSGANCFYIPAGGSRRPHALDTKKSEVDVFGSVKTPEHIHMNGSDVMAFVKKRIPTLVRQVLAKEDVTIKEIDLVIFHQASRLALDYLNKTLEIPAEKQFTNIENIGNTVSASIPIALRDAEIRGILKPQMRVLLVGFGVGLSWGACIIDWKRER